jgi:hypothetical protein
VLLAIPFDGLAENLFVEGAGALASIALAVILVERLIRRARREEWRQVREHYVTALANTLSRAGLSFTFSLEPEGIDDVDALADWSFSGPPREQTLEALRRVSGRAKAVRFKPTTHAEDDYEVSLTVAEQDLKYVRETLLPRVLDLSDDPRHVHLLLSLEAAESELRTSVRHWKANPDDADVYAIIVRRNAFSLIACMTDTYAYLVELQADPSKAERVVS